jgi:hypothetical protein
MKGTLATKNSPGKTLRFSAAKSYFEKSMELLILGDLNFYISIIIVAYRAPEASPNLQ